VKEHEKENKQEQEQEREQVKEHEQENKQREGEGVNCPFFLIVGNSVLGPRGWGIRSPRLS
jgi:hypothetical protein